MDRLYQYLMSAVLQAQLPDAQRQLDAAKERTGNEQKQCDEMDEMLGMLLVTANGSSPVTPKAEGSGRLTSKLSRKWKDFLNTV
jgi:hypothetical protein